MNIMVRLFVLFTFVILCNREIYCKAGRGGGRGHKSGSNGKGSSEHGSNSHKSRNDNQHNGHGSGNNTSNYATNTPSSQHDSYGDYGSFTYKTRRPSNYFTSTSSTTTKPLFTFATPKFNLPNFGKLNYGQSFKMPISQVNIFENKKSINSGSKMQKYNPPNFYSLKSPIKSSSRNEIPLRSLDSYAPNLRQPFSNSLNEKQNRYKLNQNNNKNNELFSFTSRNEQMFPSPSQQLSYTHYASQHPYKEQDEGYSSLGSSLFNNPLKQHDAYSKNFKPSQSHIQPYTSILHDSKSSHFSYPKTSNMYHGSSFQPTGNVIKHHNKERRPPSYKMKYSKEADYRHFDTSKETGPRYPVIQGANHPSQSGSVKQQLASGRKSSLGNRHFTADSLRKSQPKKFPGSLKSPVNSVWLSNSNNINQVPNQRIRSLNSDLSNCDMKELAGDIRISWVCSRSKNVKTCQIKCIEPKVFISPPAFEYRCTSNGVWTPNYVPDCI